MNEEEARALMSGALGEEMEKFPLRFCKPAYFGVPPSREYPVTVNNGTATLLKLGDELLAVTCAHVIEGYRRKLEEDARCVFAISNCYLDPLAQLVAEDSAVDAAVLRLRADQAEGITRGSHGIGEAFYEIGLRAPAPVDVGDFVAYAGFPGDLLEATSFDELVFGTYSSGACRVTDLHSDYITCEFEREYWITHFHEAEPETLGGLSGGPAFVIRHRPSGLISYEYCGLIYRMHELTESLFIRQAGALPVDWESAR